MGKAQKNGIAAAFVLLAAFGAWIFAGCEDKVTGGGGNDIVFPDTGAVSYSRHVQPLFNLKCTFSGCHGADTKAARGWDLTTYSNFAYGFDIIAPGDPTISRLNKAVEGRTPGKEMPPGNGYPLPENQKQGLRRWVLQGASQVP
jgi:hypothetical protein